MPILKEGIIEESKDMPEVWKTFRKFKSETEIPNMNSVNNSNTSMRPHWLEEEEPISTPPSKSEDQQIDERLHQYYIEIQLRKTTKQYREKGIMEK